MCSRVLILVACLFVAGCGEPSGGARRNPDAADAPRAGARPEVPVPDPLPSGEDRFANLQNSTAEERAAFETGKDAGWVALRAEDAGTGAPIADQHYYGVRYAFRREDVDRRPPIEVDFFRTAPAPGGIRTHELAGGWWRLRLEADGYRPTWTPRFHVEKGETIALTVPMLEANRIRVEVLEPDGSPCAEGTVLLRGKEYLGAVPVKDGVADTLVNEDEVQLEIDPRFMEGYRPWRRKVQLSYGETTRVTVRLER